MPCFLVSVWFEWREAVWVERSGEDEVEACGQLSFFFSFSLWLFLSCSISTISSASLGVLSGAAHCEAATWRLMAWRRREAARAGADSGTIDGIEGKKLEVERGEGAPASEGPLRVAARFDARWTKACSCCDREARSFELV